MNLIKSAFAAGLTASALGGAALAQALPGQTVTPALTEKIPTLPGTSVAIDTKDTKLTSIEDQ